MTGYSLTPTAPAKAGSVFAAKVSRSSPVMVTLEHYDDTHEWGPVTWLTPWVTPVRGQPCLAVLDDDGHVWAFASAFPPTGNPLIDTALLQAIIDATPDYGVAMLGFGNYVVNRSLDLRGRSNLTIRGQGIDLTTVTCTADLDGSGADQYTNNNVFNAVNFVPVGSYLANLVFEDFTIDCTLQSAAGMPPGTVLGRNLCAIECQNVDLARFSRLRVVKSYGNALVSASIDPGMEAAVLEAVTEDCIFDHCVTGTLPQYGDIAGSVIQYGAMLGGEIVGCQFLYSGGPATDTFNCHGTRIHHNTFRGVNDTPIGAGQTMNSIHSDFGLVGATIDHNTMIDAGVIKLNGIMEPVFFNDMVPTPGPLGCTIDHNTISGTGSTPLTAPAVPSSGGSVVNAADAPALIDVVGGTSVAVTIDGDLQVGSGASESHYLAPSGATVEISYATAPSWTWRRAPNALQPAIGLLAGNVPGHPLGAVESTSVTANTIRDMPTGAIQVYDGHGCDIADNIITNPAEWLADYPVVQILDSGAVAGTGTRECNITANVIRDTRPVVKVGAAFQTDAACLDNAYAGNRFPAGAVALQGAVPRERIVWERNFSGAVILGLPLPSFAVPPTGLLELPDCGSKAWIITGTVASGITDIVANVSLDREVTLIFTDTVTVKDAVGNLKLKAGDFTATPDSTLTLICDGTTWFEK